MPTAARQHRSAPAKRTRAKDVNRPSSTARGYDRRWSRFRKWYIRQHPVCEACGAMGTSEHPIEVDHIVPLTDGGSHCDPSNTQSLCKSCHSSKTARDKAARMVE